MNKSIIPSAVFLALLVPTVAASGQASPTKVLTLRDAAELALTRAPDVAAASARADEASAAARRSEAGLAPQAFATTTPGYSSGLPVAVAGRVPSLAGLEVEKTLFDPARRAEVLEAQAEAASLAGAKTRSMAALARALVAAYGRAWADQSLIANARRTLESREAMLRRVSALAQEGRRTDLEVEETSLEVARAKQALADRETELDLDRLELSRLVDWPAGETLAVAQDPLEALPEPPAGGNLEAARAGDPELEALALQAEKLQRASDLQKRAWLPVVQAEGQYLRLANYNNFDQYFVKFKPNDWAVGVSVVVPLWTGGRLAHGETAAVARLTRVRADRRVRERDLELAVRRAEGELARARAQRELADRAASLAREGLRVSQALADEGRGEPDDVDRKLLALARAEDDRTQASQGLLAARATLLDLRGDLPGALLGSSASPPRPDASKS